MVAFYIKYVGGDIYVNMLATCVSDLVGIFGAGVVQRCVGTKNTFLVFLVAAFGTSIPLLVTRDVVIVAISIFGCKLFLGGAFMVSYYSNSEFFPALFTPFAFSVCSFIAHIFACLAPEVAELKPESIPVSTMLALTLLAGTVALLLEKPTK
ncbi:unnamed protein product [Moneuplotes crassus]|uniref:Uncharacterized protein n=1 Tax=Euplotes crassus TaxID=5936 RepID=A0AAD1X9H4_EUPCR|nr:unnamed protein product [Moneuplotes crassus]